MAGVKRAVEDYEALAKDSEVDIVYVSNIHPAHKDTTILLLEHGKHVLCEKPLAVSSFAEIMLLFSASEYPGCSTCCYVVLCSTYCRLCLKMC